MIKILHLCNSWHFLVIAEVNMKYSTEVIMFKSHIKSALNDKLAWDVLVSLMNDLCSTLNKSKAVNHLLLDELKTHKISESIFIKQEPNVEIKESAENNGFVFWVQNRLAYCITNYYDDVT